MGPVYVKEHAKHHFNEIAKHAETLKLMAGPVYMPSDMKYTFNEIAQAVEGIKTLSGN